MEQYTYIIHSAKGTSWVKKGHKYIRKDGNRYIYEESGRGVGPGVHADYKVTRRSNDSIEPMKNYREYSNDQGYTIRVYNDGHRENISPNSVRGYRNATGGTSSKYYRFGGTGSIDSLFGKTETLSLPINARGDSYGFSKDRSGQRYNQTNYVYLGAIPTAMLNMKANVGEAHYKASKAGKALVDKFLKKRKKVETNVTGKQHTKDK